MPNPFVVLRTRGADWDEERALDGTRDGLKECWPWTLRPGSSG
jgi:hypothetical protein